MSEGNAWAIPLLTTQDGKPLILQYKWGKGTVTLVGNDQFFKNGQLDKADNAALAVALQEQFPNQPILFEIYSHGFRNNPDLITYLAKGPGIALLVTVTILVVLLGVWAIQQPSRQKIFRKASDERYYTQEAFIHTLAKHYVDTHQWQALYQKLLSHFFLLLERRYPSLSASQQIARLAQIPDLPVSLEKLEAVLDDKNVTNQAKFMQHSATLLEVQQKVFGHEQHLSIHQYKLVSGR